MSHNPRNINQPSQEPLDITPETESKGNPGKEVTLLASGLLILAVGIGGAWMYSQENDQPIQSAKSVDSDQLSQAFHPSANASEDIASSASTPPTVTPVSMTQEDPDSKAASMIDEQDVYFEFDQAVLSEEAKTLLQDQAQRVGTEQEWNVLVQGHTDEKGSDPYNEALSLRRATIVKEYLVDQGIPSDSVQIEGLGKAEPVCSESTDTCWTQNRRTHVVFLKPEMSASDAEDLMAETSSEPAEETIISTEPMTEVAESIEDSLVETVQLSDSGEEVAASDPIAPVTDPQ